MKMRLIDADKLMEKTENYYPSIYCTCMPVPCVKLRDIKNAPTIEVEPVKHGRIITATDNKDKTYYQYCSECKEILEFKEYPNYCPNCGAKMEENQCITK